MALVDNILTLEITEHKLYQIVVGVLNFDPWPQQQALTQRSMLYIYSKQLRKCWDGQLLNHTSSGQVTRSHFTSTCIKGPFFTSNWQLALLETAELTLQTLIFHEGHFENMKNNRKLKLNSCCLNMCSQGNMLCIVRFNVCKLFYVNPVSIFAC